MEWEFSLCDHVIGNVRNGVRIERDGWGEPFHSMQSCRHQALHSDRKDLDNHVSAWDRKLETEIG
jgi:hypothetical protein